MTNTIKLEIYSRWLEYEVDPFASIGVADPVDQEGYDEGQAFPLLKPDIDAVAYPCWRTRRQRGWYHIVNRSPIATIAMDPDSMEKNTHPAATGGDVPAELLRVIADEVDTSAIAWADKAVRRPARRCLGMYARVCKDWAHTFHRALFHNSVISSREAVTQLRTLLRSTAGCGRLRRYINRFELVYNPVDVPWLHLMPSVYALLSKTPIIDLSLSGPLTNPCPPNLHFQLPRSLLQFSAHICDVTFSNVHFQCFGDLARLYCGLPHLLFFRGEDLTWDIGPMPSNFSREPATPRMSSISFRRCRANWPAAGLSYMMRLRPSIRDCTLLDALARAIEGEDDTFGSCYCSPLARERDSEDHLTSYFSLTHKDHATLHLGVTVTARRRSCTAIDVGDTVQHVKSARGEQGTLWDVVHLAVSYNNTWETCRWIPVRWDAFDRIAASFEHLELVTITFKSYLDGCEEYVADTLAKMPHLSRSGRLQVEYQES